MDAEFLDRALTVARAAAAAAAEVIRHHYDRGVATEVFVQQSGHWVNTGWQLAPVGK